VFRRLVLLGAFAALVLPSVAGAHARLVRTFPANGAVLAKPPSEIRVVFDDVVKRGGGIEAIRNGGSSVLAGKARVVGGGNVLVLPLRRGLARGAYSARWSIVSDDGHLESGIVAFAVGRGEPVPTSTLTASGTSVKPEQVAWRWIFYAGLLATVGVSLFTLVVRSRDEERVAQLLSAAAVLTAIGAGEEAHRIGLETRAGTAFGATALAAVVVATLAGAATLARRILVPAAALALVLVLGPAFAGHAYDRGVNRINVAADALHVLGASAWVGVLLGIVAFRDRSRRAILLAVGGLVLLGATGVVRAWSELTSVSQLWDTSYGRAILVKTGLLAVALAGGWLLRAHVAQRAGAELAMVAGILVAVSVLVLLPPGRSVGGGLVRVSSAEPSPPSPLPAPDAVVVSQEMGTLGVALALEPGKTSAIVISPAGGGLNDLDVRLNGREASSCGQGCYSVDAPPGKKVDVAIDRFGPTLTASFDVPASPTDGTALLRRIETRYKALKSVFYLETLASSPTQSITALWRLERPDRISYQIPGGASGIVVGSTRWDRERPDAPWERSPQSRLRQPVPAWAKARNAHVISDDGDAKTLTFVDPSTPAYFKLTVDAKTLLPRELRMTAASHFMVDRYVRFNAPREIYPPR
jgi:copper transport protein